MIPFDSTQAYYEHVRAYFSHPDAALAKEYDKDGESQCVYRTTDGHACAVGCAIPDELYDARYENKTAFQLLDERGIDVSDECEDPDIIDNSALRELFANVDISFLSEVQILHDHRASSVRSFVQQLDDEASRIGLTVPS